MSSEERESMEFDVVIVGAGPAGLSTACRLMQIAAEKEQEISVVVLEKGSEVGAHILSGAVIEPRALTELFPDWENDNAPLQTAVTRDDILFFTSASKSIRVPGTPSPVLHLFLDACGMCIICGFQLYYLNTPLAIARFAARLASVFF